jgi:predicted metal-dependent hydrolase
MLAFFVKNAFCENITNTMPSIAKKSATRTTPSGLTLHTSYDGISYEIRKRKQAKRITIRVAHDGRVWIAMPLRAAVRDAEAFFAKNIAFVRTALQQAEAKRQNIATASKNAPPEALELPIAGCWYPVVISIRAEFGMEILPTHLVISVPLAHATDEAKMRSAALKYWQFVMVARANEVLPKRTLELATTLGETVRRIAVKDQKSLWGSCVKARRSINLNWRSILFPDEVRDYLIIHELAHLRHANHSDAYWQHVEACCAKAATWEYTKSEKWLKTNGRRIMRLRSLISV